jgi:N-acetylglutamate synthase-like GNAT family acetyltransferase
VGVSGPLIRLAQPNDAPAIKAIIDEAFAIYIARIGKRPGPMLEDYPALIAQRQVYCLVVDLKIAGTITLIEAADHLLVDNLAVVKSLQGMSFGKSLLSFAETVAQAKNFRTLKLYTNEAMRENLMIYPSLGYAETHRAEKDGFKRVFFEKRL